jgi:hypothetical protein
MYKVPEIYIKSFNKVDFFPSIREFITYFIQKGCNSYQTVIHFATGIENNRRDVKEINGVQYSALNE